MMRSTKSRSGSCSDLFHNAQEPPRAIYLVVYLTRPTEFEAESRSETSKSSRLYTVEHGVAFPDLIVSSSANDISVRISTLKNVLILKPTIQTRFRKLFGL